MVGAILGLLSSIIGAATSGSANDKTREELDILARNQKVPDSVRAGEAILREQANMGLPGYESRKTDIESSIPQTLNQAKDYISGGGLIESLSQIYSQNNKQKRDLANANDEAIIANKNKLASYLGSVSGAYESRTNENMNDIALAKIGVNQAGTQDKLNFMKYGIDSLTQSVGNESGLLEQILALTGGKDNNIPVGSWNTNDPNAPLSIGGNNNVGYNINKMPTKTNTIDIISKILAGIK
jgi:hypothetical protein